jgi:hypothetical protein
MEMFVPPTLSPRRCTNPSALAAVDQTGFSNGYARSLSVVPEPSREYAAFTDRPEVGRTFVKFPPVINHNRSPATHVSAFGLIEAVVRVSTAVSTPDRRTDPTALAFVSAAIIPTTLVFSRRVLSAWHTIGFDPEAPEIYTACPFLISTAHAFAVNVNEVAAAVPTPVRPDPSPINAVAVNVPEVFE